MLFNNKKEPALNTVKIVVEQANKTKNTGTRTQLSYQINSPNKLTATG